MPAEESFLRSGALGDASLERADFVDAATDRRLLASVSLSLPLDEPAGESNSAGTLRGGVAIETSDGVDKFVAGEGERRSGVDIAGLIVGRDAISGVEMGVGVRL